MGTKKKEMFDIFKNLLQVDVLYITDDDSLRGCTSTSFISKIVYCRILRLMKNMDIDSRISVKDAPLQLSKIYLTEIEIQDNNV